MLRPILSYTRKDQIRPGLRRTWIYLLLPLFTINTGSLSGAPSDLHMVRYRRPPSSAETDSTNGIQYLKTEDVGSSEHTLTSDAWARSVIEDADDYRAADGRIHKDIVIFVHGYGISEVKLRAKVGLIRRGMKGMNFQGNVVVFDWPSDDRGIPFSYLSDAALAERMSYLLFDRCIDILRQVPTRNIAVRVHILAHSLGCTLVRDALAYAHRTSRPRIQTAVFLGADMSGSLLGFEPLPETYAACGAAAFGVYSYGCRQDSVLRASSAVRLFTSRRVGNGGIPRHLRENGAIEIDCTDRYFHLNQECLQQTFDAAVRFESVKPGLTTLIIGRGRRFAAGLLDGHGEQEMFYRTHEWYFCDPLIFADLRSIFQNDSEASRYRTHRKSVNGRAKLTFSINP